MIKKVFAVMILLTLMVSCTSSDDTHKLPIKLLQEESMEVILSDYMSPGDIIKEINEPVLDDVKLEYSDPYLKMRVDGLINDEAFTKEIIGKQPDPIAPQEKALNADSGVDLRAYNSPVKSQNNGLCTAYATVGAMEGTLCMTGGKCSENISEQHLFQRQGRKYSTDAAVTTANKYRIADEALWPQYGNAVSGINDKGHAKILTYRYLGKDAQALMDAHDRGNFVVIGMKTPKDMLNCRSTIRTGTAFSSGGHAILSSGYKLSKDIPGGMYAIIKNSWGANCGDNGYQYVPLKDICNKNGSYCFYYEIVTVDSNKNDSVTPAPVDPVKKPRLVPYCKKKSYRFWEDNWWENQKKENRCYYKCEQNCESVCEGKPTCNFPWRK